MNRSLLKKIDEIGAPVFLYFLRWFSGLLEKKPTNKTVVFLKLVGLGDTALMLPAISLFRKSFPDYKILVVATPITQHLFVANSDIDEVVLYDVFGAHSGIAGVLKIIRILRSKDIYGYIDCEHYFRLTAALGLLSGAKIRIGLINKEYYRGNLFTHAVEYETRTHLCRLYYKLYERFCDIVDKKPINYEKAKAYKIVTRQQGSIPEEWKGQNDTTRKLLVGIHPGTGMSGLYRRWPTYKFVELVKTLIDTGKYKVVLTSGPHEENLINEIYSQIKNTGENSFVKANTKTFQDFLELLKTFDCFICNDTGPMHISAFLGVRTIGLFGPNLPARYGLLQKRTKVIYRSVSCSPCIQVHKGVVPKECKIGSPSPCMEKITVDEVSSSVFELIRDKENWQ